jgi:DNA polymerase-3 subunit epsilon
MPGLLAEVYIRMTRGQNSLVIDGIESGSAEAVLEAIDFSGLDLPVITASEAETRAHAVLLAELDKASGGKTVWRAMAEAAEPAMA